MAATNYYYLISGLPVVRLGAALPMTPDELGATCRGHLSPERAADLDSVGLIPNGRPCCQAERAWQAWETYVRNLVVRARAARLGVAPAEFTRHEDDVFPSARRQVEEALALPGPAARERALDELRWRQLDQCGASHLFDFDALVVYRLRLLLAARWAGQGPDAGRERLARLAAQAVEQARAVRQVGQA